VLKECTYQINCVHLNVSYSAKWVTLRAVTSTSRLLTLCASIVQISAAAEIIMDTTREIYMKYQSQVIELLNNSFGGIDD
jgi:hypothetical protein